MNWIGHLTTREQVLLLIVLPVVVSVAILSTSWTQLHDRMAEARLVMREYLAIQEIAEGYSTIEGNSPLNDGRVAAPLESMVTQNAKAFDLSVTRMEQTDHRIQVSFSRADFTSVVMWLARLETEFGVSVRRIEISRLDTPGYVSVTAQLENNQ